MVRVLFLVPFEVPFEVPSERIRMDTSGSVFGFVSVFVSVPLQVPLQVPQRFRFRPCFGSVVRFRLCRNPPDEAAAGVVGRWKFPFLPPARAPPQGADTHRLFVSASVISTGVCVFYVRAPFGFRFFW